MHKIKVIIKEPGKKPISTNISDSLQNLQRTVGGYIEIVPISKYCVIICDEEGRIKGYPYCCSICGIDFFGTIIICGVSGDDFADIPIDFQQAKRVFSNLFEIDAHDRETKGEENED